MKQFKAYTEIVHKAKLAETVDKILNKINILSVENAEKMNIEIGKICITDLSNNVTNKSEVCILIQYTIEKL